MSLASRGCCWLLACPRRWWSFGRGLFHCTQTNLAYVPEQHTDFIFTAVGEQLGFVGGASLLALFGLIVWRIWRTAQLARDPLGTLLCVGVLGLLTVSVFENAGMTMGILPITGIPLPLMSYGGSAIIATFAALGLGMNVGMRRVPGPVPGRRPGPGPPRVP